MMGSRVAYRRTKMNNKNKQRHYNEDTTNEQIKQKKKQSTFTTRTAISNNNISVLIRTSNFTRTDTSIRRYHANYL